MPALPPRPEPDPRERKPNRRALDGEPERQRDLDKPWTSLEPGDLHRRLYGRDGITRAQAMRQRKGR